MRYVLLLLGVTLAVSCQKIPERRIIELELESVDQIPNPSATNIEVTYGNFSDLTFSFNSDSPLTMINIMYGGGLDGGTFMPKPSELIEVPEIGDSEGEFTIRVTPMNHFEAPVGNSVFDSKSLTIEMLNENGIVKVVELFFLIV